MGVDPDPTKLLRADSCIDLIVKEIRHRFIIEGNMDHRAGLFHELQVLDQQQIRRGCDSKSANFRITIIT
jgi:hypothetical protein